MNINHKAIITVLKVITGGVFLIALGYKLYSIYKFGGTKINTPEQIHPEPIDEDGDYTERPYNEEEPYDTVPASSDKYNEVTAN